MAASHCTRAAGDWYGCRHGQAVGTHEAKHAKSRSDGVRQGDASAVYSVDVSQSEVLSTVSSVLVMWSIGGDSSEVFVGFTRQLLIYCLTLDFFAVC